MLESTKLKISESMKGSKNHFYGKTHSEETKKKISSIHKGKIGWNKGTKGLMKSNSGSFKKGMTPWNKDKFMSKEYRINCSLAQTKEEKFTGFYKDKNSRLRTNSRWKSWRTQVYERDDYTCQECNGKGGILHPHHKIPVKDCIKEDNIDLVYDVNNGVTLCKTCHTKKHKNNTRSD